MITIDELMTVNPFTLRPTDSLHSARELMTEKHIRHIPITDENNTLLGLVSQRDVLKVTGPDAENPDLDLSEVMTSKVSVIRTSDSVRQAALHLQQKKFGCLPVVDDNGLVGIVTDSDFIGVAINLLEQVEMAETEVDYEPDDFDSLDDLDLPSISEEL